VGTRAIRVVVGLAALALVAATQGRLPYAARDPDGKLLVPRAESARVAALGFESLLADYYWLRVVQVVGSERIPVEQAPLIEEISRVVVALDPWVDHPYRFAALWLSDRPETQPSANRILERGIAYHPRDWRNRFYLSFNHLYNQGDAGAAADELEAAIGLEGAPPYLARLVARLRSTGGGLDAAEAYLRTLLGQEISAWQRVAYEDALVEIDTERRARALDEARARFAALNGFDIQRVEELAWGPYAVLWTLPGEPNGAGWAIDEKSGRIVSTHYKRRYKVNFHDPEQKLEAPSSDQAAGGAQG
jgi:hypothetical protein